MNKFLALLVLLCAAAFAQGEHKIAVYATGSLGANEKEALSTKMLSSFAGSGKYKAIENSEAFFSGLQEYEKSNSLENSQIIAFGKQFGAQQVCLINIKPAFDSYHVSARIIDAETQEVVAMGEAGSSLKSFEDLSVLEHRLSSQLLGVPMMDAASASAGEAPAAAAPLAAAPQQCEEKYNINELLAKIQRGFPAQLKDCASSFAKDLAKSKMPFSKTPPPEPKSYLTQCSIDGVKARLPEGFPGIDKIMDDIQKFLQTVLNTALAGGVPNPTTLLNAASDMGGLLNGIKKMAAENPCIVDEPYEHVEPAKEDKAEEEGGDSEGGKENKSFSLGIRTGVNWSHLYTTGESYNNYNNGVYIGKVDGTYGSIGGFQAGMVFDFALSEVFHVQPGIMYVQKGADVKRFKPLTSHNIEIPMLLSLKLAVLRLNAGLYYDICIASSFGNVVGNDFGISTGLGLDIGSFYIGMFYDYGLTNVYDGKYFDHYNRTLGFNIGVNL